MASSLSPGSIVLEALLALPNRKELQVNSSRVRNIKSLAEKLLSVVSDAPERHPQIIQFTKELHEALKSIMETFQPSTMAKLRENIWTQYAHVRANTLPSLWRKFLSSIGYEECCSEPLLMELVNESIVDCLIKETFPQFETQRATPTMSITKDEENVLRYACGYIAMKLKERFLKVKDGKAAQFVECLNKMRYMELGKDGPATSFLAYIQGWIKKVGLFVISDEAYRIFVTLELATRRKLPHHLLATAITTLTSSPPHEADVSAIVKAICDDDDVLFYWTFFGIDGGIDMDEDEDTNQELLQQIIHL